MDDQINAHLQWLATPRRGKGVVDDDEKVVPPSNVHHCRDVADLEDGVGEGLDVEDLCVLLDRSLV